jgi:hypothetical protein
MIAKRMRSYKPVGDVEAKAGQPYTLTEIYE